MAALLLLVAFALILGGAFTFTNAVEWLGTRLNIGEGAVGSLLAAVGTEMTETLIATRWPALAWVPTRTRRRTAYRYPRALCRRSSS